MQAFLTGGTGFIGLPLARALVRRGWAVRGLVRRPDSPQARLLQAAGVELTPGDITDRKSMRAGMAGADIVVHNAAWYEFGVDNNSVERMQRINVDGTENVLGLAQELDISRTVYVSSLIAFGETGDTLCDESFTRQTPPRSHYERTKTEAHAVALRYQQAGLPLIIVCPGQVIGPNDHSVWGYFCRLYLNGWMPPMAWAPETTFGHAHVEDIAEGIALAAEKGRLGETYLLGGDFITTRQVMNLWATTPGGMKIRAWLSPQLMAPMMKSLEPVQRWMGMSAFMSAETVRAGSTNQRYSNAKAKRELGWSPRPPEQAWREILAAERELQARRNGGGLVAKLNPLPEV